MDVYVSHGANDLVLKTTGSGTYKYAKDELVHEACYSNFNGIALQGTRTDGWAGYIVASYDGGLTYDTYLTCVARANGHDCGGQYTSRSSQRVVADADNTGTLVRGTFCMEGMMCLFVLTPYKY